MKLFMTALLTVLFVSFQTQALELEEARSKKLITEQADGFIKANDASAKNLEADINNKRKEAYEKIFKENGGKISLDEIGKQAAKKIQEKMNDKK